MPSSNATMAWNLHRLGILFNEPGWRNRAVQMLASQLDMAIRYPTSFGVWCNLLLEMISGTAEILVLGEDAEALVRTFWKKYVPHRVLMHAATPVEGFPLMDGRTATDKTSIYICKDYACRLPVYGTEEALKVLLTYK